MENSCPCSRPLRSLVADGDANQEKDKHHQKRERHGDEDARQPVCASNLKGRESPNVSSCMARIEEHEGQSKQGKNEINGDGSAWKQSQKAGR